MESTPTKKRKFEAEDEEEKTQKKVKIEKEEEEQNNVEVELGPSGRSYDKVAITSTLTGFQLKVLKGDLFKDVPEPKSTSLAHCVSQDLKLGKGVAKLFRQKFGRIGELEKAKAGIGDIAVLKDNARFIYNMVTKAKYSDKPTYESLRQSLVAMRNHAVEHLVKHIAMPKIGCGLDGLDWNAVRTLVKNVFLDTDIKISVYVLEDLGVLAKKQSTTDCSPRKRPSSDSKRPKKSDDDDSSKKYPILDIAEGNLTLLKDDEPNMPSQVALEFKGLPDVFLGDRIFLQSGMANVEELTRIIISYGGEVVTEIQFEDANVIVRSSTVNTKEPLIKKFGLLAKKKAPQVAEKWLKDSIAKRKRQPLDDYIIL